MRPRTLSLVPLLPRVDGRRATGREVLTAGFVGFAVDFIFSSAMHGQSGAGAVFFCPLFIYVFPPERYRWVHYAVMALGYNAIYAFLHRAATL